MDGSALFEDGKPPPALQALLPDVLLADPAPEDIVVGEALPALADLGSTAKRLGVEIPEDLQ